MKVYGQRALFILFVDFSLLSMKIFLFLYNKVLILLNLTRTQHSILFWKEQSIKNLVVECGRTKDGVLQLSKFLHCFTALGQI